jgi:cathepsin L
MRRFLVAAGVGLSVAGTSWTELGAYSFDDYVQEFEKTYSPVEYKFRQTVFETRLADIKRHNADTSRTYKRGVNKFSDLTAEEFKKYLGGGKIPKSFSQAPMAPKLSLRDAPPSVDWRTKGVVTPVKNQGGCGSCWAFAATETIESAIAIKTGQLMVLSEQNMVSCTPNPQQCGGTGGCGGATAELGFAYVKKMGLSSEKDVPYRGITGKCLETTKSANITGFVKLPENDHDALLAAITTVGPIAITVAASEWVDFENGVFDGCVKDADLDHGVQLVGYGTDSGSGTDYWLVRNSWGGAWGEQGYIRIKRFPTSDAWCGTDRNPLDGTGCKGGPPTQHVCGMCGILFDTAYPTV